MQQVYNLFGEAMSISAWLGWPVTMLRLTLLSEEGKKIRGGERQSGGRIPAVLDPSVVGAAELGWTTAQQERDKPRKVFFDTYLYQK